MTDWPEIFFARHGETDWNRQRRYQGARDVPLNATGRKQADRMGPLLVELLDQYGHDPRNMRWYSSPLSRSTETMDRMRAAFRIELPDIILDDRLREISFGDLEGLLHDELPDNLAVAPGQRSGEYWHHRPPSGENYQDVADRLATFAGELTVPSVITAHGGIMRVLRHLIEGASYDDVVNWAPPQGYIARFADGSMRLYPASGLD